MNICITTYNRFDLCDRMVSSILGGSLIPDSIYVLNTRGGNQVKYSNPNCTCINSMFRLGLAEAFNWFIENVPEVRIICNDDLVFGTDAYKDYVEQYEYGKICSPIARSNLFSMFSLDNTIVSKVGLFDTRISPKYYYFEDNDYMYRANAAGVRAKEIKADVQHLHSSTLAQFNEQEVAEHHKKFRLAQKNYILKWGGLPNEEKYTMPYNGRT